MAFDAVINTKVNYDTKDSVKNVGNLKKSLVGLAAAAALAFAVKKIWEFGSAFETTFAKVSTLIDETVVDMKGLQNQIKDLSVESGVAADQLNEALYQAISAGVEVTGDGADAMAFLERNIQLAKGGFTDLTTAVDTSTTVLNAYGMEQSRINEVTDILIKTQNAGKTTVDELGASLAQVIPTAAAMGVSFEQVGAAMATLTAQGTPTAQAATQVRGMLAELGKAGTKSSNILLELSGKSFKQLQDEGKTLTDILGMMEGHAQSNNLSMLDLFSSIEAGQGALALTGNGAEKFNETMVSMTDGVDATNAAFEKVSDTASEKLNKVMNELKVVLIDVFLAFAPLISSVLDFLLNTHLLVPLMGALAAVLIAISINLGIATVSMWGLNAAMLANPIGLVIAAIALLVFAGIALIKNWDKVGAFFASLWEAIIDVFKAGVNGIITILNLLPKLWELEINLVLDGLNFLIESLNKIPGIDLETMAHVSLPKIPKLAAGGLAFGETNAIVGDNLNSQVDPEVIAPLSKLQGMMGGSNDNQTVQLVLDGRILGEAVIGRTNGIMAGSYGVKIN